MYSTCCDSGSLLIFTAGYDWGISNETIGATMFCNYRHLSVGYNPIINSDSKP